jgi:hypothetical protein
LDREVDESKFQSQVFCNNLRTFGFGHWFAAGAGKDFHVASRSEPNPRILAAPGSPPPVVARVGEHLSGLRLRVHGGGSILPCLRDLACDQIGSGRSSRLDAARRVPESFGIPKRQRLARAFHRILDCLFYRDGMHLGRNRCWSRLFGAESRGFPGHTTLAPGVVIGCARGLCRGYFAEARRLSLITCVLLEHPRGGIVSLPACRLSTGIPRFNMPSW